MAAQAEAINYYFVEQASPEDELARRRSHQFKGHVAIEGLQAEYDGITELAELTDGQMRTELELTFDGDDLYGPDGRSITVAAEKGLQAAREEAKNNPNLWFEVGRRSLELEEVHEAVDMIKTGKGNTLILTTNFPWALKDAKEDVGGYNVTRQQALRRGITKNPETGKILLISQTLDGSNDQALDAVDAEFGFRADPGEERLGQRQTLTLSAEEQATIMDRSVSAYDREMSAQFGGEWYAGRRPVDYRNTYDFVRRQRDLIDEYKTLKLSGKLTGEIMYDMAATINARFKGEKEGKIRAAPQVDIAQTNVRQLNNSAALYDEMRMHGRRARRAGKSFSACGSTWKAEGLDESTEEQLKNAGYGNKAGAEKSWHGGKIYKNAKCVSCKEVKSEVGVCRICKDCVKHPKGNLRTVQGRTGDPKKSKINKEPAKVVSLDEARAKKRAKAEAKTL